jgi:ParB family chromosome partitioning protein
VKESLLKGINLDAARAALQAAPDGSNTNLVALYLSLDGIQPDPNQPRRGMDAGEDIQSLEELADSILQHGVLQPITVEALGQGQYQIVAGERRWRAAKLALERGQPCGRKDYDLRRIPAVIVRSENPTDRLEMQLVENLARADMRGDDIAAALQSLMEVLQVNKAELARRLGRSRAWIAMMLTKASPEAAEIAARIGVPLEQIGLLELQRLMSWQSDPEKAGWIDQVVEAVQAGRPFNRSLLNAIEERERQVGAAPESGSVRIEDGQERIPRAPDEVMAVETVHDTNRADLDFAPDKHDPMSSEEDVAQKESEHEATEGPMRYGRVDPDVQPDGSEDSGSETGGVSTDWAGSDSYAADLENSAAQTVRATTQETGERSPARESARKDVIRIAIPRLLADRVLARVGMEDSDPSEENFLTALEALVE